MKKNKNPLPSISDSEKRDQIYSILAILKILGVNRAELARRLGVSRSLITQWSTGYVRIAPAHAIRLHTLVPEIGLNKLCPRAYTEIH